MNERWHKHVEGTPVVVACLSSTVSVCKHSTVTATNPACQHAFKFNVFTNATPETNKITQTYLNLNDIKHQPERREP